MKFSSFNAAKDDECICLSFKITHTNFVGYKSIYCWGDLFQQVLPIGEMYISVPRDWNWWQTAGIAWNYSCYIHILHYRHAATCGNKAEAVTRMHVDFIPDNTDEVALLSVINFNLYHAGFISGWDNHKSVQLLLQHVHIQWISQQQMVMDLISNTLHGDDEIVCSIRICPCDRVVVQLFNWEDWGSYASINTNKKFHSVTPLSLKASRGVHYYTIFAPRGSTGYFGL